MVRVAMTRSGCGRGDPQCGIVTVLRQRVTVLETEGQRVRAERDQLAGQVERLGVGNQQLRARIGELAWQVEELRRAGRRQAAPFSKDRPNPSPRRPGRKAGDAYGRRARRPVPDRVDRVVSVPLPAACPSCGGPIAFERVADQHQEDFPLPKATQITRFEVAIGRCGGCRRRIQPRHPEQTSDALGAAGVQVGSRAVALAAWCNKGLGLPAGKVARLLAQLGLEVTPGGVTQAVARAARRCEPTYTGAGRGGASQPGRGAGRDRLTGRRPPCLAVGLRRAGRCRVPHRAGTRVHRCCGGARRGVCGGVGTRRVGAVPQVPPRHPPDVPGASAPPRGGSAWDASAGRLRPPMRSAGSSARPWRSATPAMPASWTRPRPPRRPRGWARRSTGCWPDGPALRQPQAACAAGPGTRRAVHLPGHPGGAGDQLAC